ncbi:carbonic anhydrase [Streptomyces sp. NPDC057638]|uniref:carbonic anhydrase n=1 Tax=Streptomyces sp. NPDC057638 TaxID=3346190 RepID=UPI0036A8A8E0
MKEKANPEPTVAKDEIKEISVSRRRTLLQAAVAGGVVAGTALGAGVGSAAARSHRPPGARRPTTPAAALLELKAGNQRWSTLGQVHPREGVLARQQATLGQAPWAIIVGCIDSRVPPELIFDQGLGDLFVTRTAGQVLDSAVYGSVSYAVTKLNVPLVVVLGHEDCGAVTTAQKVLDGVPNLGLTPRLAHTIHQIVPAVEADPATPNRLNRSINNNVRMIRSTLLRENDIAQRVALGTLAVIGARYDLGTTQFTQIEPPPTR